MRVMRTMMDTKAMMGKKARVCSVPRAPDASDEREQLEQLALSFRLPRPPDA